MADDDFDAVVVVVRAWRNGNVDLELRGNGGPNDGKVRAMRLPSGCVRSLLTELARLLAEVRS